MTVYVDDMYRYPLGQFGRMKMSHMMADTTEELLEMTKKICVQSKWIQNKGTSHEHFDISIAKRILAIQFGAVEVTMREMAAKRRAKRSLPDCQ
jgi:hypothetical protein